MKEIPYTDILLICSISAVPFWVRFPGENLDFELDSKSLGENKCKNISLRISNLKFQRVSPGCVPVLLATTSSRIVVTMLTADNLFLQNSPIINAPNLRDVTQFPLEIASIDLCIIFWEIANDVLIIYGRDKLFVTVILHYTLPEMTQLEKRLKWLKVGIIIFATAVLLRSFDTINDIAVAIRTEHTVITLPPSQVSFSPSISLLLENIETERRKHAALQVGKLYYNMCTPYSALRACAETYIRDATLWILNDSKKMQTSHIHISDTDIIAMIRCRNFQHICICKKKILADIDCPLILDVLLAKEYHKDSFPLKIAETDPRSAIKEVKNMERCSNEELDYNCIFRILYVHKSSKNSVTEHVKCYYERIVNR